MCPLLCRQHYVDWPSLSRRGHRPSVLWVLQAAPRGPAEGGRRPAFLLALWERGCHGRQWQEGHISLFRGQPPLWCCYSLLLVTRACSTTDERGDRLWMPPCGTNSLSWAVELLLSSIDQRSWSAHFNAMPIDSSPNNVIWSPMRRSVLYNFDNFHISLNLKHYMILCGLQKLFNLFS